MINNKYGKLKTLTEWSRLLGVPYNTVYSRYSKDYKVNEILKIKG